LPGYEASQWYGIGAPENTPNAIIHKLNKEINAALADPKFKVRLVDVGGTAAETEKWAKVIRAANIKVE
jgi:tripartite-type tricarboxylate transporter receptor subunit TctC